jgi:hypothetical protein
MSERVSVELKYPIEIDGVNVSVLHMRRPKVRDRLAVDNLGDTDAKREVTMLAMLADVAPTSLHELDMCDYAKLQKAFTGFL